MSKRYLVGVDLGTSATKATLYTTEGVTVAEAAIDVPLYYPYPGAVEQELSDFYASAAATVRECISESGIDPRDVAAIAFASQMAGVGAVDEAFRPAARFDSWLDMRCQPYIEAIDRDHGDLITQLTGCPPTCDHGPKILWWQHERPEDYARMARFVMPSGYVAGKMAGLKAEEAFIDYTFLHFTALSDAQAGTWSSELVSRLGVDAQKLPRIVPPWQIVGEAQEASARDFGLVPGTPIAAGCGDTAAGALGAGICAGIATTSTGRAEATATSTTRWPRLRRLFSRAPRACSSRLISAGVSARRTRPCAGHGSASHGATAAAISRAPSWKALPSSTLIT